MDIKSKRDVKNVSGEGGEASAQDDLPETGSTPLAEGALAVALPEGAPVTREQRRSRR